MRTSSKTASVEQAVSIAMSIVLCSLVFLAAPESSPAYAQTSNSLTYSFEAPGTMHESASLSQSASPYFWLASGAELTIENGVGSTIRGALAPEDPWRVSYASRYPLASDGGAHPQNMFRMLTRVAPQNVSASIYLNRKANNLANPLNRREYDGESLIVRYKDDKNFYYAGIREDGFAVIKKQVNGVYQTLASKQIFSGTYSSTNYNLIPLSKWIGLKVTVQDTAGGQKVTLSTDVGQTGAWTQALSVVDDPAKFGPGISGSGLVGIDLDFADIQMDNLVVNDLSATQTSTNTASKSGTTVPPVPSSTGTGYDALVLKAAPVMYLAMNGTGTETDKTGNGHNGSYKNAPTQTTMPNGDKATAFNGTSQYLSVPSHSALSIPTTGKLTWEAWIRPETLQFSNASGDGYVDWMGKCDQYSPTCEWEARMYSASTAEGRPSRISGYVFNSSAGLGSAADWQPASNVVQAGKWLHVVAEYDTTSTPSGCSSTYPGQINIWVNGVKWSMANHMPTGCMSQFSVKPAAKNSALNIGTMALDTWFKGAIGKVALYDRLLSQSEISEHYKAMTGNTPNGSCSGTCTMSY